MKSYLSTIILLTVFCIILSCGHTQKVKIKSGVSHELAIQRKAILSDIHYKLSFHIPTSVKENVTGSEDISFTLKEKEDLQIDFQGLIRNNILVNGKEIKTVHQSEHLLIPRAASTSRI